MLILVYSFTFSFIRRFAGDHGHVFRRPWSRFFSNANFVATSVEKAWNWTTPLWFSDNSSRRGLDHDNSSLWSIPDHISNKLVGFYHVAVMNEWHSVVASQLSHLDTSGLLGQSYAVYVTLLGNETSQAQIALQHFNASGKLHSYQEEDLKAWEFPTLARLRAHCMKNARDLVYYFHSKGASKPPGSTLFRREQEWRKVMEQLVFDNWHDCVSLMQRNVHKWACGARYFDPW